MVMTKKTKRNRTESQDRMPNRKSQKRKKDETKEDKNGGIEISNDSETEENNLKNKKAKKNGGIQCEICGKKIRSSYYMKFHMAVHTGEKNYVCGICEKGYQQKWNLITHVGRVHSKEKPFRCHDCGRSFGYSSHFKRHVKTHFLDKIEAPETVKRRILNPHGCDFCGKSFESNYRLHLHLRIHTGNRPFVCEKCGKSFTTKRLCFLHAKKIHGNAEDEEFVCEHCGRIFHRRSSMVLHLKTEHDARTRETIEGKDDSTETFAAGVSEDGPAEKQVTPCEVCGKIVTRGSVKKHLNIHYRNRIYSCRYCGKEFLESGQRVVHERKHTGEKPYVCDICGKGHAQYSNLLTHRKRYHNLTSKTPELWKQKTPEVWKQKTSLSVVENARKSQRVTTAENQIDAKTFDIDSLKNKKNEDDSTNKSSEISGKHECTGDETLEEFLKIANRWVKKKFQESKNKSCKTNGENVSAQFDNPIVSNRDKMEAIADGSSIDQESQFHDENLSNPIEKENGESHEKNDSSRAKKIKFRINEIIFDRIVRNLMETDAKSQVSRVLDVINGKTQRKSGDAFKRFLRLMKRIPDNTVTKTEGGNVFWHCWICPSKLKSRHLLARHLLVHEPEENRPYECDICFKSFTQSNNFKEHVMSHRRENQFCCDKCGCGFRHKSHFNVHMRKHDTSVTRSPQMKHECSFCGKKHNTNHQRIEHERTHTKERPFLCKICGRQFAASSTLNRHQSTHRPSPSHQCSLCLKFFRQKSSLKRHMATHSEHPNVSRVGCDCGKTFSQSPSLKKHKMICKNRIRPAIKPFPCPVCLKRFLTKSDLKRHLVTHDASKKFECSICFVHLKTAETFKRHVKRHNDETSLGKNYEKTFRCEKCDSTFLNVEEMRKHTVENHLK